MEGRFPDVTRANGSTSEYRHDAAHRLTGLIHRRADGSVLAEFAYTLDGNGRRIALEETVAGKVRRLSWHYDRAGRLLEESIDDGSGPRVTAYAWDGAGNRIRRDDAGLVTTYVYDANDRLLSETTGGATTTYAWDANGNLARRQEGGKTTVYHWNSQNRLTRIDDGARRIDYGYDAEGRRIKRLVSEGTNSVETHYVIDSARAHGETIVERTRVGSGAFSERTYVHTPDGTGELLSELKGGTAIHYYPDGQGSTRLIADQAQNVLETHAHDAFGRRTGGAGGDGHQYTGEYFDAASGFYHLRARDYDPRIGRFVSMDEHPGTPRIPLTLNKYLYGNADPVNNIDPSGNFTLSSVMGGVNGMANLAMAALTLYDLFSNADQFGEGLGHLGALIVASVGGAAGFESLTDSALPVMALAHGGPGKIEKHHTIPIYMCGEKKQKKYAFVDDEKHREIHRRLSYGVVGVRMVSEKLVKRFLKIPGKGGRKPTDPIVLLAKKRSGRQVIVNFLMYFYYKNDYLDEGEYGNTIGAVFPEVAASFVSGATSLPTCRR